MRIAIDMDDCICNTLEWDFACAWMYNKEKHPQDKKFYYQIFHAAPEIFNFSEEEKKEFYLENRRFIINKKLIYPKPFVKETIDKLMAEGHEIYILTSREDFYWLGDAYGHTSKWLKKYKINYTSLIVNCIEKGLKCAEIRADLLIDDNPKFISQVNSQGIRTIIIAAPYNLKYKNVLNEHASCWPEVFEIVQDLDSSLNEYRKFKEERERSIKHNLRFIPITNKTILNAVKLQERIDKRHCVYLDYKHAINSKNPYYFIYDGDHIIGLTGTYELEGDPDDVWLGVGGILPKYIRQGFGKRVLKKLIEKAKEDGYKNFRIISNFKENPTAQSLYREVSQICEIYDKDDKVPCRYIYSKSLTDSPVKKWGDRDAGVKAFEARERASKKILKDMPEY